MDINIQALQGICNEFIDDQGQNKEVSIVISPLKVTSSEEQNKIAIITGCNMWKSCYNEGCYYSMASRKRKDKTLAKT